MSYELTKWALKVNGITATEKLVLAQLCTYADNEGRCFPKQSRIADECGLSRQSVISSIKKLKEIGYILVENNGDYLITGVNVVDINVNVVDTPPVNVVDTCVKHVDTHVNDVDIHLNKPINKPITNQKIKNRFQEFWEKYPVSRREEKTKTETSYRVALKKISEDELHRALDAQLQYWEKNKTEDKYKKYILGWIRGEAFAKFLAQPKNNHAELVKAIQAADRGMRWNDARYGMTLNEARLLVNPKKCEAA